jgi:phage FluMu gp28-like protein
MDVDNSRVTGKDRDKDRDKDKAMAVEMASRAGMISMKKMKM